MSRWDALKPSPTGHHRSVKSVRKNATTGQAGKLLQKNRQQVVVNHYRKLIASCKAGDCLSELTTFVVEHIDIIPPEENANTVVNDVLLNALENMESGHQGAITKNSSDMFHCITTLLRHPKHRSAMLAPLTDTILDTGVEQKLTNPVRTRLLDVLCKNLVDFSAAVECFTAALHATKAVDGRNAKKEQDLNLGYLQHYFDLYQEEENQIFLNMIEALVTCRPAGVSIALCKSLLLRNHRGTSSHGSCCGLLLPGAPKLLRILHCSQNKGLPMRCVAGMFRVLPIDQWLALNRNSTSAHSWTFRDKILCLIEDLLLLLRCIQEESADYTNMVVAVLNHVPFNNEERLIQLGQALVEDLSCTPMFEDVLVKCFGGHETPSGELTQTPIPIKHWLHSHRQFTHDQLTKLPTSSSLVCGLLRSNSSIVLDDMPTWIKWKGIVEKLSPDHEEVIAEMMESLLYGRDLVDKIDNSNIPPDNLLSFVLPYMESFLSSSTQCQLSACLGFNHILESDWAAIHSPTRYPNQLLALCTDKRSTMKVQSECYRTIGKICPRLFKSAVLGFESAEASGAVLTNKLLAVLSGSNPSPSIRTMALFATGNLIQALHIQSIPPDGIDMSHFCTTKSLLMNCSVQSDEKVAVNALRASGLMCCLLVGEGFYALREELETCLFLEATTRGCARNLAASATHLLSRATWKQRHCAKKKGLAACRCLDLVFSNLSERNYDCFLVAFTEPVSALLKALSDMHGMDGKLANAILSALRAMHKSALRDVLSRIHNDALCDALLVLVNSRFTEPSESFTDIESELEATLIHLLSCVTETSTLLRALGPELSETLLLWLAKQPGMDVHLLEMWASAAGSLSFDVNVQLLLSNLLRVPETEEDETEEL